MIKLSFVTRILLKMILSRQVCRYKNNIFMTCSVFQEFAGFHLIVASANR
jgi:hypothetical protein